MHIAFVTFGFKPLRTSGFDIAGERLVKALLGAGHKIDVITGKWSNLEECVSHPNLRIYRIQLDRSDWFGFAYRAAQLLDKNGPFEVVHFYDVSFSYAFHGNYVASLQHSFRQRIESLGTKKDGRGLRWLYKYSYYSFAKYYAERPGLKRAKGLLASSSTTFDEYINHYHVNPRQIALARHCVDTDFFKASTSLVCTRLRYTHNIGLDEPVILFAGFITPRKGLEYLAKAMSGISPTPKLVIVGKWRDEINRNEVFRLLEPVRDRVVEVGFVPDEQMPDYYSMADLYTSPSLMEGFGLPLGEALACGTPVVAFDVGAAAEVVGPGGILVPVGDVHGLAEAISNLLQDVGRRRSLGDMGREHVQREFSVASMLQATLEAYQRFLGKKS